MRLAFALLAAAAAATAATGGVARLHTPSELSAAVCGAPGGALVAFNAAWCSHCKALAPELDAAAARVPPGVTVAAVDCTASPAVCADFDVRAYPTLLWLPPRTPAAQLRAAATRVTWPRTAGALAAFVARATAPHVARLPPLPAGGALEALGRHAVHAGADGVLFVALGPSGHGAAFAAAAAATRLDPPGGVGFAWSPSRLAALVGSQLRGGAGHSARCAALLEALHALGGGEGGPGAWGVVVRVEAAGFSRGAAAAARWAAPSLRHLAVSVFVPPGATDTSESDAALLQCDTGDAQAGSGVTSVTVALEAAPAASFGAPPPDAPTPAAAADAAAAAVAAPPHDAAALSAWVRARSQPTLPRASARTFEQLLQAASRAGKRLVLAVVDGGDVARWVAPPADSTGGGGGAPAAADSDVIDAARAAATSTASLGLRAPTGIGFGHFPPAAAAGGAPHSSGSSHGLPPAPRLPPPSLPFLSAVRSIAWEAATAPQPADDADASLRAYHYAYLDVAASSSRYEQWLLQFDIDSETGGDVDDAEWVWGDDVVEEGAAGANRAVGDGEGEEEGEDTAGDGLGEEGDEEGEERDEEEEEAGAATTSAQHALASEADARDAGDVGGGGQRGTAYFTPRLLVIDPEARVFYSDASVKEHDEVLTFLREVASGAAPARRGHLHGPLGVPALLLLPAGTHPWLAAAARALLPPHVRAALARVGLAAAPVLLQAAVAAAVALLLCCAFCWAVWRLVLVELLCARQPARRRRAAAQPTPTPHSHASAQDATLSEPHQPPTPPTTHWQHPVEEPGLSQLQPLKVLRPDDSASVEYDMSAQPTAGRAHSGGRRRPTLVTQLSDSALLSSGEDGSPPLSSSSSRSARSASVRRRRPAPHEAQ